MFFNSEFIVYDAVSFSSRGGNGSGYPPEKIIVLEAAGKTFISYMNQ